MADAKLLQHVHSHAPMPDVSSVEDLLSMARLVLSLGQVRRATMHVDGEPESDTTHTVMLVLVAMDVAARAGYNPGLAAQFAAVHDLTEAYAGDTNTAYGLSAEAAEAKAMRESDALQRITGELAEDSHVVCLLWRYEAQQEPEARLVRCLDKMLPQLTHLLNKGIALQAVGLTADALREKHAAQGASLASQYPEMIEARRLLAEACDLVRCGIISGDIRAAQGGTTG